MSEEVGVAFAKAMEGAITVIFLIAGILEVISVLFIILGIIIHKKGKKEENKDKKIYRILPIIFWVIAGIIDVYLLVMFLH